MAGNHEKTNVTNSLVFFQQDHHLSPVRSSRPSPFWGKKDSPTVYAAMRSMDRMATNNVGMECIPSAVAAWWKHRFADFTRYRKWKRKDSGRMLKNVVGLFELMLLYLWFWRFQGWPGLRYDSNMHASCNHPNFSTWAHHASSTQPTLPHPSQAVCRAPWNLRKISMSSCPEATQATHQSCPRSCDFWPQAGGGRRTEGCSCGTPPVLWTINSSPTAQLIYDWLIDHVLGAVCTYVALAAAVSVPIHK